MWISQSKCSFPVFFLEYGSTYQWFGPLILQFFLSIELYCSFFFGYGSIYRLTLGVYNFLTWLSLRRLNPLPRLFSLYIALPCLINRQNYGFALLTPFAVLCCSLPSVVLHNTLPFPFPLLLRPMHLASLSFLLPLATSSKFLFSCSCFLPLGTRY